MSVKDGGGRPDLIQFPRVHAGISWSIWPPRRHYLTEPTPRMHARRKRGKGRKRRKGRGCGEGCACSKEDEALPVEWELSSQPLRPHPGRQASAESLETPAYDRLAALGAALGAALLPSAFCLLLASCILRLLPVSTSSWPASRGTLRTSLPLIRRLA